MSNEINTTENHDIDHSMHDVIVHAKRNLKSMTENQTELEKSNLEYQGIKDQLMQLLEVGADDLTPQEFTDLISLVERSENILISKNIKKEEL